MRDSFINNRKALFALLVCAGFIAGHPLTAMAEPAAAVSQQQTNEVSGIVRDATGEAVIGASVVEKGTNNGIITDLDGKFTLKVKSCTGRTCRCTLYGRWQTFDRRILRDDRGDGDGAQRKR